MRAMILAAGFGTRMKSLTNKTPKPLLKVKGKALIRYNLDLLKKAGIREVIVNLHHLPAPLKKYLKAQKDFKISFSYEKKILGTGGGIAKAKKFFKNKAFVVINCDILMKPNIKAAIRFHKKKMSLATMILRPPKRTETYETLGIDVKNKIVAFKTKKHKPGVKKMMFTGVHIFDPKIFSYFPKKKFFCINNDVYKTLIKKKKNVFGFVYKGQWKDVGTLKLFLRYNR